MEEEESNTRNEREDVRSSNERSGSLFFRPKEIPGLELYSRNHVSRFVPRHVHMVFSLGLTEAGVRVHRCRKGEFEARPGSITVVNPDEAHSGGVPRGGSYSCRTLRMSAELLRSIVLQITKTDASFIDVAEPVFRDNDLAGIFRALHASSNELEREEHLLTLFSMLLFRHSRGGLPPSLTDDRAVLRVREYLHDSWEENVSLSQLARIAGLSPFHLTRLFSKVVGVPPHQYLLQVRLQKAKDLIATGLPIVQVAQDTGFFDQSHLHRAFQRQFGTSPGRYLR